MQLGYMGMDQHGEIYHMPSVKFPRKALLEKLGRKSAQKMYQDKKSGGTPDHVGWIIGGLWITVFRIMPLNNGGVDAKEKQGG